MSGGNRKLRLVHGRVVTKRRWRMIRDYVQRRGHAGFVRGGDAPRMAYEQWVRDFERFLIYGLSPRGPGHVAPTPTDSSVPPAPQVLPVPCGRWHAANVDRLPRVGQRI